MPCAFSAFPVTKNSTKIQALCQGFLLQDKKILELRIVLRNWKVIYFVNAKIIQPVTAT